MSIPRGWTVKSLDQLAETALGKMLDRGKRRGLTQVPYLRNVNVQWDRIDTSDLLTMELADNERERFRVREGDLLVCEGGEVGRAAIWNGREEYLAYQKALHRVRSRGDLDLKFLRYLLEHYRHDGTLARYSTGSTIAHLPQQKLQALPIPHPPSIEQQRIVEILDDHLSRLGAALSSAKTAQQRLKSLLVSAFRQLLLPAHSQLPGSSRWATVGELARVDSGPAFKSTQFGAPGEGVRLVRGDNIEPGRLRWDRTRTWPDSLLGGYEHLLVNKHDIILAMDRPVISTGLKLAQVGAADLPALLVQRVARIRCGMEVDYRYLYIILQCPQFLAHLREGFTGTQIPHITLQTIRDYAVPLLPVNHQLEIVAKFEAQMSALDTARRSIQSTEIRAAGLRRSLPEAAFTGWLT
ncbi:MAG: restriction endonuclease subunit S [Actinobacteria bacterium]|nr:restriction endonuclease subunit S [Actinomycetota bacterium]